ncbi:hypothetical protein [Methylobacterium sp. CM6257]
MPRAGELADAYRGTVLTKVPDKRATTVRTLAAQVRAQRSRQQPRLRVLAEPSYCGYRSGHVR